MILIIFSILLINLFLSLDNIIPILLIAGSLKTKNMQNAALFLGLIFGAILRVILVFFAALIFNLGAVVYIFSGIFLLYIGMKGLLKKEKEEEEKVRHYPKFSSVVSSIIIIDLTLSLDNIAALLAVTQNIGLLFIGISISVLILFGLSFGINRVLNKFRGLDIAAYVAILFLAFKFLAFPFGVDISSTITSATIITICIVVVTYFFFKENGEKLFKRIRSAV